MQNSDLIVLITDGVTPYRVPLFNELDRQLKENSYSLAVVYGYKSRKDRAWSVNESEFQFKHDFLVTSADKAPKEFETFYYPGLIRKLRHTKPKQLISIGFSVATLKVFIYSFFTRTPFYIWTGSISSGNSNLTLRKFLARVAHGFIVYGNKARDYVTSLGVSSNKIEVAINTVDVSYFVKEVEEFKKGNPVKNNKKHLTCISYFRVGKNLIKVLEAIKLLNEKRQDFILELIGEGEELEKFQTYISDHNLGNCVSIVSYKQTEELPEYLAKSDCYLFQTNFDIWGLSLVEAMASGITCISSINAGATADLIKEGDTGFAVDFNDVESVVSKIEWVLDNPDQSEIIAKEGQRLIQDKVTISSSARGFVKMLFSKR